eukprot:5274366-Prymnesium_polylepis.1
MHAHAHRPPPSSCRRLHLLAFLLDRRRPRRPSDAAVAQLPGEPALLGVVDKVTRRRSASIVELRCNNVARRCDSSTEDRDVPVVCVTLSERCSWLRVCKMAGCCGGGPRVTRWLRRECAFAGVYAS